MARLVAKSMPRDVRRYVNMCETRLYRKAAASSMQAAASSRTSASKKQMYDQSYVALGSLRDAGIRANLDANTEFV